jgi:hypothetical protein
VFDDDEQTDDRKAGDNFAKKAEAAVSEPSDTTRRAAATYALLAIYHELRRNDLGEKIDALTEQMEALTEQTERAAAGQGETASSIGDLADIVERGRPRHPRRPRRR